MTSRQPSRLLGSLFEHVDAERRLTVLNIGPALPETVDFFSRFRCRLHFLDLFSELPIVEDEDGGLSIAGQFTRLLAFPEATSFDICLLWDLFNYLDAPAIAAFLAALRPYLSPGTLAHAYTVHNLKMPQRDQLYAIAQLDEVAVKPRQSALPGYTPHPQGQLKSLLTCFNFHQSVLLADSRIELLLGAKL